MPAKLDGTDRRLLNLLQSAFPLVPQPFAALAQSLSTSEDEVLTRTQRLRGEGLLRQLSAVFDTYHMGYRSTLVAMMVPPEHLEAGATAVSAHPGVSHNYGRDHPFNLWFVLAVPHSSDLAAVVADLAHQAGAVRAIILPAIRVFKVDVRYDMVEGAGGSYSKPQPHERRPRRDLTQDEIALVKALQEDLPIVSRPFAEPAQRLGLTEEELLAHTLALAKEGIMRRFAAVLHHQQAGFTANGMTCWAVPEERIAQIGERLAQHPEVSHCYQRPTYPDWPYPLFAMIHARSRQRCEELAAAMSRELGVSDYVILYSTKEYKKERVRFFCEDSQPTLLKEPDRRP